VGIVFPPSCNASVHQQGFGSDPYSYENCG
jgi:hypothetical protein